MKKKFLAVLALLSASASSAMANIVTIDSATGAVAVDTGEALAKGAPVIQDVGFIAILLGAGIWAILLVKRLGFGGAR